MVCSRLWRVREHPLNYRENFCRIHLKDLRERPDVLRPDNVNAAEPVVHSRRGNVHLLGNLLLRNANLASAGPQSFDHPPMLYANESRASSNLSSGGLPLAADPGDQGDGAQPIRNRMTEKGLSPEQEEYNRQILRFVRPWMRFRKLSQRAIADGLGLSEATVSKWLNGRQTITIAQFTALCQLLSAAPEEVLCGSPHDFHDGNLMRRLAELSQQLTDEQLRAMIAVGEQFANKKS